MSKIILTNFVKNSAFNSNKAGTTIIGITPELFEKEINIRKPQKILDGYAPFCKLLFFKNWTETLSGTLGITDDNKKYLVSDYLARRKPELPVLTRWFEGISSPIAKYLVVITYDAEQLKKEKKPINGNLGVVAILGQMIDEEEPMNPATMIRNALGISEGGSDFPLDKKKYLESIKFWKTHATVKI